jgi:hypothetical protein
MKTFFNLKKALTFVCILAFVTLLIPFAALPAQAAQNVYIGDCYRVAPGNPIIVDGMMDEAYAYGTSIWIDLPSMTIPSGTTPTVLRILRGREARSIAT